MLAGADLAEAKLWGTDLSGADLAGANLHKACFDETTKWPEGFDWQAAGTIHTDQRPIRRGG